MEFFNVFLIPFEIPFPTNWDSFRLDAWDSEDYAAAPTTTDSPDAWQRHAAHAPGSTPHTTHHTLWTNDVQ